MASPKVIGNYEIIAKIGQGGMGAVFKARQITMDRVVALKILPPRLAQDDTFVQRFLREAKSAGQCSHPNLISVYDFGEAAGYYFFSMEFVDGPNLKDFVIQHGPLGEAVALDFMIKTAEALAVAHRKGIVHRDVKPDNIIVGSNGEPKLADLGLAKPMSGDADVTMGGKSIGTPAYMSPEQARGDDVDGRADLYCLGSTFWFLLTGEALFSATTSAAVLVKQVTEPPRPICQVRPDVSRGMESVLAKLLEKEPDRRYQDADGLIEVLRSLARGETPRATVPRTRRGAPHRTLGHRSHSGTSEVPPPTGGADRRKQLIVIGVLAVLIGIGLFIGLLLFGNKVKRRQVDATATAVQPVDGSSQPESRSRTGSLEERAVEARKMIAYARDTLARSPEDFDRSLQQLAEAKTTGRGTAAYMEADDAIRDVQEGRRQWARIRFAPAAGQAEALLRQQHFDEAMVVIETCPAQVREHIRTEVDDLVRRIETAGNARLDAHLGEAARRLEQLDLAGADRALEAFETVPFTRGRQLRRSDLLRLRYRIDATRVEVVQRVETRWQEAANILIGNLIRKRFDRVIEDLAKFKADDRYAEIEDRFRSIPVIIRAFEDYDRTLMRTVEGLVGQEIKVLTATGETAGKLDLLEADPRTQEPVLKIRQTITHAGVTGSTLVTLKFSCLAPEQLLTWGKAWKPRDDDERFLLVIDALRRRDAPAGRAALTGLTGHALASVMEERVRVLEVGRAEVDAEIAWKNLATRLEGRVEPEQMHELLAALTSYQEAHGKTQAFATNSDAWREAVHRCRRATGGPDVPPAGPQEGPPPDAGLVRNGDFEAPDFRPWRVSGELRYTEGFDASERAASLWGPAALMQDIPVEAGRTYRVQMMYRARRGFEGQSVFEPGAVVPGGGVLSGRRLTGEAEWRGVVVDFQAPAERLTLRLLGRDVVVDQVSMHLLPASEDPVREE